MVKLRFMKGDRVRCLQSVARIDVDLPYFLGDLNLYMPRSSFHYEQIL